jgi:choline monooxygenase
VNDPVPMQRPLEAVIGDYDPAAPLAAASTIPADWYVDPRVADLERPAVFGRTWQLAGRLDQVQRAGEFVSCVIADEPIVVVRGADGVLRAFFNVCRHHAAAVVTEPQGCAHQLRCPYHGWTYSLDGSLKGTPDFAEVAHFDRASHGLVPLEVDVWEGWIFVKIEAGGASLADYLGQDLRHRIGTLHVTDLKWAERRHYVLGCNWKVFVDNYLDGGYHVPHLHKGLDSVLDYSAYTIELGERFCLQSSPLVVTGADPKTEAVRLGDRASYFWIHPNLMINCYGTAMDTNLVIPRGVDRTEVVFDFFFADVSGESGDRNTASIEISQQIQDEDVAICESVQRGLMSRAYRAGRLSVRREAGEQLFHRLLHADLTAGLAARKAAI